MLPKISRPARSRRTEVITGAVSHTPCLSGMMSAPTCPSGVLATWK